MDHLSSIDQILKEIIDSFDQRKTLHELIFDATIVCDINGAISTLPMIH